MYATCTLHRVLSPFTSYAWTLTYHAPIYFTCCPCAIWFFEQSYRSSATSKNVNTQTLPNLFPHIMLHFQQTVTLDSRLLRRSGSHWIFILQRPIGLIQGHVYIPGHMISGPHYTTQGLSPLSPYSC